MSKLTVNIELQEEGQIVFLKFEGQDIPSTIFLHENTGGEKLGPYAGVVFSKDFTKYAVWKGEPIKVFGNKFVRSDRAKIQLPPGSDPNIVVENTLKSIKELAQGLRNEISSTQVYDNI